MQSEGVAGIPECRVSALRNKEFLGDRQVRTFFDVVNDLGHPFGEVLELFNDEDKTTSAVTAPFAAPQGNFVAPLNNWVGMRRDHAHRNPHCLYTVVRSA